MKSSALAEYLNPDRTRHSPCGSTCAGPCRDRLALDILTEGSLVRVVLSLAEEGLFKKHDGFKKRSLVRFGLSLLFWA